MLTNDLDNVVRIWRSDGGSFELRQVLHTEPHEPSPEWVGAMDFSPDGTRAVLGHRSGELSLWDTETGNAIRRIRAHRALIGCIDWSPNGKYVCSGTTSGDLNIVDAATGTVLHEFAGHNQRVFSVAFHPAGEIVASVGDDERLRLWDVMTGQLLLEFPNVKSAYVAWSPDGDLLATGYDEGISIWPSRPTPRPARPAAGAEGMTP